MNNAFIIIQSVIAIIVFFGVINIGKKTKQIRR